ncbi:MAG: hydroxymethylbilane synthase [Bdellovibrionales bacterium]|nr:hydroxymethylbilane synthase [Bdellovibrionales bacterium]
MSIRIGTRGSLLALTQSKLVLSHLNQIRPELACELVEIKTLGDRKQGTANARQSDKKDWVYDLEIALLHNEIDFAIHSGKDCPSEVEPGTALRSVLERADPRDAFIGRKDPERGTRLSFAELSEQSVIGTASLRRRAQILKRHPNARVLEHRGNVPTRIQKLDESKELDGIILACAGLNRLAPHGLTFEPIETTNMLPALNQGTLVVQFREGDTQIESILEPLSHSDTQASWLAERAVAKALEGDCRSAIGIFATVRENLISLSAEVLLPDGSQFLEYSLEGDVLDAENIGSVVGEELLKRGAKALLDASHR